LLREERKMDAHQLGKLHLQTDYVFENGTSFYERLGDERAAALLKALSAEGYRITPAGNVSTESEHRASR
jgi:hypothetical protein